jgi:hypothetical protein
MILANLVQLLEWLSKHHAPDPHVVMEPSGVYHEADLSDSVCAAPTSQDLSAG